MSSFKDYYYSNLFREFIKELGDSGIALSEEVSEPFLTVLESSLYKALDMTFAGMQTELTNAKRPTQVGKYTTSAEQSIECYRIANEMKSSGLEAEFVRQAVRLADEYEGAYDLMKLWSEESDELERASIIEDLKKEFKKSEKV